MGFPFINFEAQSSTYLVACCSNTLLSPSQVLLISLSLYRTASLLKYEYPCPPSICLHYLIVSVANHDDFGFNVDDIACNYWITVFYGFRIFIKFLSQTWEISILPLRYTTVWARRGINRLRVNGYSISKFSISPWLLLNCLRTQAYLIAIVKADNANVDPLIDIINLPPLNATSWSPNLFSSPSTILKNCPF